MQKHIRSILVGITLLAAIFRFYALGNVPPGLHRDEAFLGYNAYSILKTGRDMSGTPWPIHLPWFLYSPAGYSYATLPTLGIFDLNAFAVRFPSALFGALTPLVTYAFLSILFKNHSQKTLIALLGSLQIAISPWHINLSRTATENTLVVFFLALGTTLYILWTQKQRLAILLLAFLFFLTTLGIYQAPRAFLPLFVPLLILLYLPSIKRRILAPIACYVVAILLPLVFILASPTLSLRLRTVSLFATDQSQLQLDQSIREDGVSAYTPLATRMFHNKILVYTNQFLENYFSHFTYTFLFTDKGLPDRYRVPNSGLLYLQELPLLLVGIYVLLRYWSKESALLIGWMLLAPLGSALTFDDVPNLQRTLLVYPALSGVLAIGAVAIFRFAKEKLQSTQLTAGILSMATVTSLVFYLHQYYLHVPIYRSWYRQDGYEALVQALIKLLPNYSRAEITNHESAPTIFFLFYTKYDPATFQHIALASSASDHNTIGFEKFVFAQDACPLRTLAQLSPGTPKHTGKPGVLYVNFESCTPPTTPDIHPVEEIKRHDGSPVFRIYTVQ